MCSFIALTAPRYFSCFRRISKEVRDASLKTLAKLAEDVSNLCVMARVCCSSAIALLPLAIPIAVAVAFCFATAVVVAAPAAADGFMLSVLVCPPAGEAASAVHSEGCR
jgi:hypothetical protein